LWALGYPDAALADSSKALGDARVARSDSCHGNKQAKLWEAEVDRIACEIARLSTTPNSVKGEACFEHALAVARAQQAKSSELRTAMSTARLWRDQGKSSEARNHLAPVYRWFTEGFDTLDLRQAKALLEQLAT
jgi:predicted ATPase